MPKKRGFKHHQNVKKKKQQKKEKQAAEQREIDARAFLEEYMQYDKDKKKSEMAKSIIKWSKGKYDSALKKVGLRPKRRDQKIFMTKKQWEEHMNSIYIGDHKPWLTGRGLQDKTSEPIPEYILNALKPKVSVHPKYGKLRY
jgi:hypothetical protein